MEKEIASDDFDERRPKCVLDTLIFSLIRGDPGVDEKFVEDHLSSMLFGGHETTGLGMTWAVYLLGQNTDAQRKLQDELDQIFGSDPNRDLTDEDVCKLKYMDMVIKEAQRIIPSVPGIVRRVPQDTDIDGHVIPAGTLLSVLNHSVHRDERFWPEPEKFEPERFEPERSAGRHPFAYTPFSAGPRNCIAKKFAYYEMKVVLAHVFKNFNVTSLIDYDQLVINPSVVSRQVEPLPIRLESRIFKSAEYC